MVELLSSWLAEQEVKDATWISEFGYLLLPSRELAEIPLKRRKSSIQRTNNQLKKIFICHLTQIQTCAEIYHGFLTILYSFILSIEQPIFLNYTFIVIYLDNDFTLVLDLRTNPYIVTPFCICQTGRPRSNNMCNYNSALRHLWKFPNKLPWW